MILCLREHFLSIRRGVLNSIHQVIEPLEKKFCSVRLWRRGLNSIRAIVFVTWRLNRKQGQMYNAFTWWKRYSASLHRLLLILACISICLRSCWGDVSFCKWSDTMGVGCRYVIHIWWSTWNISLLRRSDIGWTWGVVHLWGRKKVNKIYIPWTPIIGAYPTLTLPPMLAKEIFSFWPAAMLPTRSARLYISQQWPRQLCKQWPRHATPDEMTALSQQGTALK